MFLHALEKQHSHACSQYIYLSIINHCYHKRLPEPGPNSVPRSGAGAEDPYFFLDIKIEKAGKSLQFRAADRAGLEGHWGWVEPRCPLWPRGWGAPFALCLLPHPLYLPDMLWRCVFIDLFNTVSYTMITTPYGVLVTECGGGGIAKRFGGIKSFLHIQLPKTNSKSSM